MKHSKFDVVIIIVLSVLTMHLFTILAHSVFSTFFFILFPFLLDLIFIGVFSSFLLQSV